MGSKIHLPPPQEVQQAWILVVAILRHSASQPTRRLTARGDGLPASSLKMIAMRVDAQRKRRIRTQSVRDEWIGQGINLNAVAPGKAETAMVEEGRAHPIMGPHIDAFPMPVGRSGRAEELASLICFLLSPNARFIVGSVLFIDGGTDAQFRANDFPSPMSIPPS